MLRPVRFLYRYQVFSLVVLTAIVGLILQYALKQVAATHWLLGVVSLVALLPVLAEMWKELRAGKYGIEALAVIAVILAVYLKQYWAALVVVIFLSGSESVQAYAEKRARRETDQLAGIAPKNAHVLRKGKSVDIKAAEVRTGDTLAIKKGETVPADAVILEGSADFDEEALTGESVAHSRSAGDLILSGSINTGSAVTAKALHTAEDSQYQQILKLVRSSAASPAPFVRLADRFSIPFAIAALLIGAGVWVTTGQAMRFLEVIIVATPGPLLLAAPLSLLSGMTRASRYGIIAKTGSAFERLAEAPTIAFGKTGTLTTGELQVDAITAFGSFTRNEVLTLAASLEQGSQHSIARALQAAAATRKLRLTKAKHVRTLAGYGLQAHLKNSEVLVGRAGFLAQNEVAMPPAFRPASIKQTATFVAVDGKVAGIITFKDEPRPDGSSALERLRGLGVSSLPMLTGDSKASAQTVAKRLGITEIHADLMPAEKLHTIEAVEERPLAFVGHGVHDAPVMTAADVGIALGARGDTAAAEASDIVILPSDLNRIATARAIARRTFRIARQSIIIGVGLSMALVLLFVTGWFTPLQGALLQEAVDLIVIVSAMRAHSARA